MWYSAGKYVIIKVYQIGTKKRAPKKGLGKMTKFFDHETAVTVAQSIKNDYPNIKEVGTFDVMVNENGESNKDDSTIYLRSFVSIWYGHGSINFNSQEQFAAFLALVHYMAECDNPSK